MSAMKEPVRIGVIGAGAIGATHARAAVQIEETELVALADLRIETARAVGAEVGCSNIYGSAEELLSDDRVEAVILAMPACVRTPICLQAFEHGKHVLNEKPLSMNADEARSMIAAQGDLVAGCCTSRLRLTNGGRATAEILASGVLGDIRVVRVRALLPAGPPEKPPVIWRYNKSMNAGGIMSNWGCYDLDFILGTMGEALKPVRVLGNTWTIAPGFDIYVSPGSDAETHLAFSAVCEGGEVLLYERGEQVAHLTEKAWSITGTKGTLHFDIEPNAGRKLVLDSSEPGRDTESETIWAGDDDWDEVHRALVRDFAVAVQTGGKPMCTLEEAFLIQRVTEAAYRSAESGQAEDV